MQDNIASMLQNVEKTEAISDQANHLNEQASVFKKKSEDLQRRMKCKNMKMTAIIVGVLLLILVPIITKAKKRAMKKIIKWLSINAFTVSSIMQCVAQFEVVGGSYQELIYVDWTWKST